MYLRLLVSIALCSFLIQPTSAAVIVDFEELPLAPESYFDGYGFAATSGSFTSQGAVFQTNPFGPGWSYSNQTDTTTPGFSNQWSAYAGSGFNGSSNYVLGTTFNANEAYINLPTGTSIASLYVTNTTYAALSMRDGDAFAKQFGGALGTDPDYFKVTFTGFTQLNASGGITGNAEVYLADFRFADSAADFILDTWRFVDLTGLGHASSIGIAFESSDVGMFGINTPTYVAIDHLTVTTAAVPEPSLLVALPILMAFLWLKRPALVFKL